MSEGTELGRFLRARRGQIGPREVGLPAGTGIRRTPGLRREELATLAGVSVDYYTRLERGRETRPSPAVVAALGEVLRLTPDALRRLHELVALAAGQAPAPSPGPARAVRESVRTLLETLRPSPAYVVSRANDLLAANRPGLRLLPASRTGRRSAATSPATCSCTPWAAACTATGRRWRRTARPTCGPSPAEVGSMRLSFEVMEILRTNGQRLVSYQAPPGTPDHDALLLLDMASPSEATPTEGAER